jgi:hypothetical protein
MVKIVELKPLPNFILFIKYNDGVEGVQELEMLFKKLGRSQSDFEKVWIDNEMGGVPAWEGDFQIDALKPYLDFTNQTFEQYIQHRRQNVA